MAIGIIGAMDEEIDYFQEYIEKSVKVEKGHQTFYKGNWNGEETVLVKSGVGKVNAAMAAQKMIDLFDVTKIIFTGVAGAANPSLNVGDILISVSCQQHDIDASPLGFKKGTIPMFNGPSDFKADPVLVDTAYNSAQKTAGQQKVLKGKVVSGDQFIADKEKIRELRELFNADCVEMEGAAVAQAACFNNIPYVVIRSISDKANGEANRSFQDFMKTAADNSAKIVADMMKSIKNEEN
ncbi:5'-methylthioadenosine/adenosylhomocysteine nucleosidase [Salipaludibacillus aurantiacus]|uniref:adenosylhomocysteine nucleosidase n=1 Tax=Salipaludibacillus aurantiacus TaxID=1601833 RepID=A0A1H9WNS0_9BACI|nr:5'-methylthioadenosine/adenosylhomocysteine nucleosidase [Salipaludibacillus aurantiacus]SES35337.1 adenosylhomocysteine nucleosidase [Salipaludibacillus aurantiacus]